MSEISNQALMLGLVAGFLLGVIFFGGLWCTVRNAVAARRPALWFIGSMMLRISIVTWGFYLLLDLLGSSWKILLAGLLGFFIARLAATRLLPVPLSNAVPIAETSVEKAELDQPG
ncbi:ATP synthase subunit I [Nitrosovibrio sp. Nv4]|uniref:ATP synthase subunit I n=1 Tax=Nitrosovibrio sp. Nv4 TaxID=1945880 RepID=UPI000BC41B92|nr:ATP synthase subunit I [Nitrosovibrio sp. Nv4]SOD41407.1 F1/F0 ATPase, subunit 2 [Nitrosovibrio sp. Nv4]